MKKALLLLSAALTLTGCASTSTLPGGLVTPTMSNEAFAKATKEERESYLKIIQEEDALLTAKKDAEYSAGRPVFYGDVVDGFTIQWNKKLSLVHIYDGHINPMGMEALAKAVLRSDEKGNIKYENQGGVMKATVLFTNVSSQEGLGRLFIKGGFQVLSAGVNGAWAAKINANAACKGDCGGDITIVGGNNVAGATSTAQSQSGAVVDIGCTNCGP